MFELKTFNLVGIKVTQQKKIKLAVAYIIREDLQATAIRDASHRKRVRDFIGILFP